MTRVLLIGGSGQLGTAIRERWSDCEIAAPRHDELDLRDRAALRAAIERARPDVLVNAAALNDVDRCEEEPAAAFAVNAVAVGEAARLARDCDAAFVTISSDYVFDGRSSTPYGEDRAPGPLSVYGASKLAGEHLAACSCERVFIVRTCGLYGPAASPRKQPRLIDRALAADRDPVPLRVVDDVVASPTFAGDLAAVLRKLIATDSYGLYHAADVGPVSWYDFAREAVRQAGIKATIEPISAAQWKAPAKRPRFSALENANLDRLGLAMPSWREGIGAYLALQVR